MSCKTPGKQMFCPVLLAGLLILFVAAAVSADWVAVDGGGAALLAKRPDLARPALQVVRYDETEVVLEVSLSGLEITSTEAASGDFASLEIPGEPVGGEIGAPGLPVLRRLFRVPSGAEVRVSVDRGAGIPLSLAESGFSPRVLPRQPLAKVDDADMEIFLASGQPEGTMPPCKPGPFQFDEAAYTLTGPVPAEPVVISDVGMVRGCRVGLLEVRPVAYDAAAGALLIWPQMTVTLSFLGGDGNRGPAALTGFEKSVLNPQRCGFPGRSGGNYLIVTAEDFAGSAPLTQFVNAKTARGFTVTVYTVLPGTHRDAIKMYIQGLWGTPDAPDYLLIVGDATGTQSTAVATATNVDVPAWVGGGTYHWVTDLPYACMDGPGDWHADMAFGRISVRTVSDLQGVVDKILYVEADEYDDPSWTQRTALIAGVYGDYDAEGMHDEEILEHFGPAGIESTRLYYVTLGARTQHVTAALNQGCFLASYFGHSSGFQAWSAPYFNPTHMEALTNQDMYPFVISFSCSGGQFQYDDYDPGVVERFVRMPNKGGIAGYGPTGPLRYEWSTWANLHQSLIDAFYLDGIREFGPAVQAAIGRLISFYGESAPVCRDYAESFVLLGDPSMCLPSPPQPNYLILTAEAYAGSAPLNQLIAARTARGLDVTTHVVASGTTNTALRSYVQSLWGTPDAPEYILLVGDTDGTSATTACVPHFTGGGDKHAPTDWPYGCMDAGDDWYPEIPVGRWSVRSVASLQDIVDKTLSVESGDYPDPDYITRGAFLANADTYGQAEPTHEWVIENCLEPAGCTGIRIYEAQGGDTADVTAAMNQGCLYAAYMGHSSSGGWWGPAFTQSNVNALTNEGLYGLVCGWSCNTSNYTLSECFGETWLRASKKGAAAYISASNYIYWYSAEEWMPSVQLEKAFFRAMLQDNIREVGPAWLAGLYTFLTEYGGWDGDPSHPPTQNAAIVRNFFEEFVILGDPALYLPLPSRFQLTADPPARDLCIPGDSTTVYTVSVGRTGGFDEAVTLTVDGLPAGAAASFVPNGMVPPFASTLTVSNLAAAPVGAYSLVITGTSASMQQTMGVGLQIASALPSTPLLSSPDDGATGVARQPEFTWQASSQAATYGLQVATDSGFSNIVYARTVTTNSHQIEIELATDTQYYWRVMAGNGCGDTAYSAAYGFRTISQVVYYTELFTGSGDPFDLGNHRLLLTPDGGGSYYSACLEAITALPTDPSEGTPIGTWTYCSFGPADDCYYTLTLAGGAKVRLYGTEYGVLHIGSNGFITFEQGDTASSESLSVHFNEPRISAAFDDLNPGSGGSVSWQQLADRVAVTWLEVPQYGGSDANTFQIELFFDGQIRLSWLGMGLLDAVAGISAGDGLPADFVESNLSATLPCAPPAACCLGETCQVLTEAQCAVAGGIFKAGLLACEPNPCVASESSCLVISEIVAGTESGNCPRWVEITNLGSTDFTFASGGLIVQSAFSQDVNVDVSLAGVVVPAGGSFVIVSNAGGTCTGAFDAIYETPADLYTSVTFGLGNERFILTDTNDGSHLIDIYGEFGVHGAGQPWEFTQGYSYRLPAGGWSCAAEFALEQWHIGGVGSLAGPDPTSLLRTLTNPGTHVTVGVCSAASSGDLNCDGIVNVADIAPFAMALTDPQGYALAYPGCHGRGADLNVDCLINGQDIAQFVDSLLSGP